MRAKEVLLENWAKRATKEMMVKRGTVDLLVIEDLMAHRGPPELKVLKEQRDLKVQEVKREPLVHLATRENKVFKVSF